MLVLTTNSFGQTRAELEAKRLQIIKNIEKTSKVLEKTQKDKYENLTQIKVLEEQMSERNKLINNFKEDVSLNEKKLNTNQAKLDSLSKKLVLLQDQYGTLLRLNYLKKRSNSKWSYLLSSSNLNNLLLRWKYMHQYDAFTKNKLTDIKSLTEIIEKNNVEISKINSETIALLQKAEENIKTLEKEQKIKDNLIKKLTSEESKLKVSLSKHQKERENLNAAIEKVILAELAKSKTKSKTDAKTAKGIETDNIGFANNKGGLSWPVSNATITGKFGNHTHPTLKNVEISNNGIDFTITGTADVKCVFEGEVVGVTQIPGFKNMVIIKHGTYYTVYSKMDEIVVTKGQKLKKGASIGKSYSGDNGKSFLHFELWKNTSKQDPQKWLVKK